MDGCNSKAYDTEKDLLKKRMNNLEKICSYGDSNLVPYAFINNVLPYDPPFTEVIWIKIDEILKLQMKDRMSIPNHCVNSIVWIWFILRWSIINTECRTKGGWCPGGVRKETQGLKKTTKNSKRLGWQFRMGSNSTPSFYHVQGQ